MMLKTSPKSQIRIKIRERPSAEWRRKFSIIWGEKTTIQQAMDIELCREGQLVAKSGRGSLSGWSHPQMPLKASTSRLKPGDEEYMLKRLTAKATCELSLKKV